MSAVLGIDGLRVSYAGETGLLRAVDGVSLSLAAGQTLGLVGESGCGKSTVPLAAMGLLPPAGRVLGGSVRLEGEELLGAPDARLRAVRGSRMAMVFQNPMTGLNPYLRIGEQVAEPARLHLGLGKREAWDRAVEALAACGIPEAAAKARRHPHEFSGGMRQRAMIAMALVCRPRVILADEPTTALDVAVQTEILAVLRDLQRAAGLALLLISHDLDVVAEVCGRVAVMYAGRVVEEGPTAELLLRPLHPYTRGLLACRPPLSGPRRPVLGGIPGQPPAASEPLAGCAFAPRCPHATPACRAAEPPLRPAGPGRAHRCLLDLG